MIRTPTILALLAPVLLTAGETRADDVFLRNGRVIFGEVEVLEKEIRVRVEHGVITLPRDEVLRIEDKVSDLEVYREKARRIEEGTAAEHYRLGLWCRARKLPRSARREFELALAENPDHLGARLALGHLRIDGEWSTEEEYMLSRGFTREGGRWISPEEREARAERQPEAARVAEREERPVPAPAPPPPPSLVREPRHGVAIVPVSPRRRHGRRGLRGPVILYTPTLVIRPGDPGEACSPSLPPPFPIGSIPGACPPPKQPSTPPPPPPGAPRP